MKQENSLLGQVLIQFDLAEFQSKFLNQIMSNEAALLLMQHGLE